MTALDEWPALVSWNHCPVDVPAELADAARRDRLMYELGRSDGYADGMAAAERELAERWAELSRMIRADANRWSQYRERHARELEAAKPRPGDFTGQLTAAEYFGAAQLADAA